MRAKGQGLIDLSRWPAEPASPRSPDENRLTTALRELCGGWMPPERPRRYARWILEASHEFSVDPFLLAALLYRQSRCLPQEVSETGVGLAQLDERMHAPFLRHRRYHYWILERGSWKPEELELPRFAFVSGNLRRPEPSIYFAAALLHLWQQQCPQIDGAFGSVAHRHAVSHFFWGDRVEGTGAEDRVFEARRRLIAHYLGEHAPPRGRFEDLPLACPLEGTPRKLTSALGSERAEGARVHRGVDFASTAGEPVLAVAEGQVVIAGVDRPTGAPQNVEPEAALTLRPSQMGPGGLFVMIRHARGLFSAYMHLQRYLVRAGQQIKQGEVLGYVGKSGIRDSGAHLHFELRYKGKHIDPIPHLAPYVFPPAATYLGQRLSAEEQRVRRVRRRQRWRAQHREPPSASKP